MRARVRTAAPRPATRGTMRRATAAPTTVTTAPAMFRRRAVTRRPTRRPTRRRPRRCRCAGGCCRRGRGGRSRARPSPSTASRPENPARTAASSCASRPAATAFRSRPPATTSPTRPSRRAPAPLTPWCCSVSRPASPASATRPPCARSVPRSSRSTSAAKRRARWPERGATPCVSSARCRACSRSSGRRPSTSCAGANPGNTGFYLDGVRVPALFHIALGPSVIHPYLIAGVDFYPGAYPANFGGFVSGIMAARTTAPPADRVHASADVTVYDAGGIMTAPWNRGRGTVAVAARYSYTGALFSLLAADSVLRYGDYQLRVDHPLAGGQATVFAFGALDELGWRNLNVPEYASLQFHRMDMRWRRFAGGRAPARRGHHRRRLVALDAVRPADPRARAVGRAAPLLRSPAGCRRRPARRRRHRAGFRRRRPRLRAPAERPRADRARR